MRTVAKALILYMAALWCGAGAASAAEIILYDFFDFGGQSVTLTDSAPDLRAYNFDNDLESFRVISGQWRIYRDANYQSDSGPSLTVGPGDYPNIEALGYPQDRMSSVRLLVDPVAVSCPAPYQVPNADGVACTFTCARGTVPDQSSGQCVCQRGYVETGTDNQGRRICGPQQVEQPTPPVLQLACRQNSAPDASGRCACVAGTVQTGLDQQGRPICLYRRVEPEVPTQPTPQPQPQPAPQLQVYEVDGLLAIGKAQSSGFRFSVSPPKGIIGPYCVMAGPAATAIYRPSTGVGTLIPADCWWTLFDGRNLAPGWRMTSMAFIGDGIGDRTQFEPAGLALPVVEFFVASRPFKTVSLRLGSITLEGPAGRDWWDAFACRGRCPD